MIGIVEFAERELGVKLYPGQARALTSYYRSGQPNWLFLAGRRSGKTLLSDIIACYEAVVPDFSDVLMPDEPRFILIVSVRQDSANVHISNIDRLLRRSKALRELIVEKTQEQLQLTNGVTIISLPSSSRAVRGYGACTVLLDELAHFVDSQGNSSADAVFDAVQPVLATYGDRGRLVITTTPLSRTGIVFDLFDRAEKGELEDFYITRATSQEMNPKISDRVIKRAFKRDAESAAVEYLAEFADPIAAFLDSEAIERAVDPQRKRVEKPVQGTRYYMAIDPATMGDRYAFGICHAFEGVVVADYFNILKPPVDPNEAEGLLWDLYKRFKPAVIRCDTASTVERLKGKIPVLEYTPFSRPFKQRIYGAVKEALNLGQLVLYRDNDLIDELKALQIRNGVDIAAPKAGRVKHDDLATVLALCVEAITGHAPGTVEVRHNPFYGDGGAIPEGYDPEVGGIWTSIHAGGHEPYIDHAYEQQKARAESAVDVMWKLIQEKRKGA